MTTKASGKTAQKRSSALRICLSVAASDLLTASGAAISPALSAIAWAPLLLVTIGCIVWLLCLLWPVRANKKKAREIKRLKAAAHGRVAPLAHALPWKRRRAPTCVGDRAPRTIADTR